MRCARGSSTNGRNYTPSGRRDQTSRVRLVEPDAIAKVALARLSVADVDRWPARMRKGGLGEGAIRNPLVVLRAALAQAVVEQFGPYACNIGPGPANPGRIGWWWQRARTLSGIDVRWRLHNMRHLSATMAIAGGHDVRTVAGRLGHADPAMALRVYARAVEGADEAVAESRGRLLERDAPDRSPSEAD